MQDKVLELEAQLQTIQAALQDAKLQQAKAQQQLEQLQGQNRHLQSQFQKLRKQANVQQQALWQSLQQAYTAVEAMESSKFWRIRTHWFQLKRQLGLTTEPEKLLSKTINIPERVDFSTFKVPQSQSTLRPAQFPAWQDPPPIQPASIELSPGLTEEYVQDIERKVQPFTLVGKERIRSLCNLAHRIEVEKIAGDVVECGVCNGGTAALLAHFATASLLDRKVWLFDSFSGMPETTEEDGEAAKQHIGKEVGEMENVMQVLRLVNAEMSRVEVVKGWFQDTFPTVDIPQIALLNIDADWYVSVKLCLEKFYDAVVPGGFISFDDYGHWQGCRQAVNEFFAERNLPYKLYQADYTAHWFQKL